jgi:hypothetical protein
MDPLNILSNSKNINYNDLLSSFTLNKQNNDFIFKKAVIVECINQVGEWNFDKLRSYYGRVVNFNQLASPEFIPVDQEKVEEELSNFKFFLNAPRNSLIIKFLNDNNNFDEDFNKVTELYVAYPFFSSHIMLPAKPGEVVWCLSDLQEIYWLSRVHGPLHVEDTNYTHHDRKFLINYPVNDPEILNYFENFNFDFNNGLPIENDSEFLTIPVQLDLFEDTLLNPFNVINENAAENNSIAYEPVPRYTPRAGDLVLQGSNNATIALTTNRGYGELNRPDSDKLSSNSLLNEIEYQSGCIDIVVGRGRLNKDTKTNVITLLENLSNENPTPLSTTVAIAKNTRNNFETFKTLAFFQKNESQWLNSGELNSNEGDPDLVKDSARIYLSMSQDIDETLNLKNYFPLIPSANDSSNAGKEINNSGKAASVLLKSDEIRIVARKDSDSDINGSIKIIKEGEADNEQGNGRAIIAIQSDGTIMIDGPKIVIGSGIEKTNGNGNQIALGLNASQPLVLGNELKDKLESFMDAVTEAFDYAAFHVHPTGTGPSGPPTGQQWTSKSLAIKTTKNNLKSFLSKIGKTL